MRASSCVHGRMEKQRKAYPLGVSDEEWRFVAPYLQRCREEVPQRRHGRREAVNAARWIVRTGAAWRLLPNGFPPWEAVYQQTQGWLRAQVFEALGHDRRVMLRLAVGRRGEPSAAILDSRTLRASVESGHRAGYDGAKRQRGSKIRLAVDTLGYLLAAPATAASEQDRAPVGALAAQVQAVTRQSVEVAFVDQGDTGASAAAVHGMALRVVKQPEAKRGFVLRPKRWVLERNFARSTCCRRLVRDYERLPQTRAGLHFIALACPLPQQAIPM